MDRYFAIFGKTILVILILFSLIYGGYYIGLKTKNTKAPEAVNTEGTNLPVLPSPDIDNQELITISGGVSKSAGLSFDLYTLQTTKDWLITKESQTQMDQSLKLTNNGYEITIFQAATGGALCLYPGDDDFEGPSSKFQTFKELATQDTRILRRSGDFNGLGFTVCQRSGDESFQQPTNYGHISIKLPDNWTQEGLNEIDQILTSLKKI